MAPLMRQWKWNLYSNIMFINIWEYPETISDARTMFLFKERIANDHLDKKVWKEIWKQFNEKGVTLKKITLRNATFIHIHPNRSRSWQTQEEWRYNPN
ncbi:hypothetical protein OXIME_000299 [Oxyplasma meridianum]|uniref:Uncharacterized protein n=1 Tax=Oxyplasma meridianum TaxID=3073602 RepID=A0AAX4NEH8_9ARCH